MCASWLGLLPHGTCQARSGRCWRSRRCRMCRRSLVRRAGAEQLFASGCKLLISVTSAGQIAELGPSPYFVLIDRALRDEGTSYHYLPPSLFSDGLAPAILDQVETGLRKAVPDVESSIGVVPGRQTRRSANGACNRSCSWSRGVGR